jgi:hypothetical protein
MVQQCVAAVAFVDDSSTKKLDAANAANDTPSVVLAPKHVIRDDHHPPILLSTDDKIYCNVPRLNSFLPSRVMPA